MGRMEEALVAYRRAVELCPESPSFHSNLADALHFHPDADTDPHLLSAAHQDWYERHAAPLARFIRPHANDPDPERRLRVGYVSADFRNHVVGRNLLPLMREHDHRPMEIFCYSQVARPDAFTDRFASYADSWRNIGRVEDEQAAELIRSDGIDILVDFSLHMGGNRLLLFARKPAPVQATFAGYPGGTGLPTIDWRLTDPYLDPPGEDGAECSPPETPYVEGSFRLPDSFWCYDPQTMEWDPDAAAEPSPEPGPLPALDNGYVTFGCLNNFCKVNDAVLELWSRVLQAVPRSRLAVLVPPGATRQRVQEKLGCQGVAGERLDFVRYQGHQQYLAEFRRIDVSLDTLPYNGHTTSLDSLWMGVPVVSLAGKLAISRAGLSILSNVGLPELVAYTPEKYVSLAAGLAADLPHGLLAGRPAGSVPALAADGRAPLCPRHRGCFP